MIQRLILSLVIISLGFSANAQITFATLNDCLSTVRENNRSLKKQNYLYKTTAQQVQSAWSNMLPQLKAFGTLDDYISLPVQLVPAEFVGGQAGEFAKIQFGTQYTMTYGMEANVPLVNTSVWKNVKSAQLGEEVAYWQKEDQELNVLQQAVAAYYMALLSREAMNLNAALRNSNDSLLNVATVRLQNGAIEQLEYNRIKSLGIESDQRWREASKTFLQNLNTLKVLSGIPVKDSLTLAEQIESDVSALAQRSLNADIHNTPRYRMLSLQSAQRNVELSKQKLRYVPELSFYARYTRQAQRNEFNFFSGGQSWFDIAVMGIRADWYLFTGLNRRASIRQASYQREAATLDLQEYDQIKTKEYEALRSDYNTAVKGLVDYREHYTLSDQNYSIAMKKYEAGVYSLDQFITIYQEMVRSQNQYLIQLANYLVYDSTIQLENESQSNEK